MNNHAARIERLAQIRPADLSPRPTLEELNAELAKREADPAYVFPKAWSPEVLAKWEADLEREIAEFKRAP